MYLELQAFIIYGTRLAGQIVIGEKENLVTTFLGGVGFFGETS